MDMQTQHNNGSCKSAKFLYCVTWKGKSLSFNFYVFNWIKINRRKSDTKIFGTFDFSCRRRSTCCRNWFNFLFLLFIQNTFFSPFDEESFFLSQVVVGLDLPSYLLHLAFRPSPKKFEMKTSFDRERRVWAILRLPLMISWKQRRLLVEV